MKQILTEFLDFISSELYQTSTAAKSFSSGLGIVTERYPLEMFPAAILYYLRLNSND